VSKENMSGEENLKKLELRILYGRKTVRRSKLGKKRDHIGEQQAIIKDKERAGAEKQESSCAEYPF